MKLKLILASALLAAMGLEAGAVRAIDKFLPVTQPDGTTLLVKKCGDERAHYLTTSDGALVAERDGAYYFGTLDAKGLIVPTTQLASNPEVRTAAQASAVLRLTDSDIERIKQAPRLNDRRRAIAQDGMGRHTSNFPRKGDIHGLVILVEYKDYKFQLGDAHGYFHGLLNTDGFNEYGATGCAAEYFRGNSNNQFRPVFDVYGPVTLSQNRSYYGGNDYYGNDLHPEEMVIESIKKLDPEVDFSVYDNDGDGMLDNVFVIYAGQGEASYGNANTVWPHSWNLSYTNKSFMVDGVQVDSYGCSNEWERNTPDGVGTFIHEFSHVMGLPDLYSTSNTLYCTPRNWSVLDYGPYNNDGRTPPNYSTYERLAMGWIEPTILNGPASVNLQNLADSNQACIIQTPKTTEYFLFENRQQTGWDRYLPGHGMLIWHVDFVQDIFDRNQVNNSSSHQYVEIEKASGVKNASSEDDVYAGWAWPGTKKKTEFTDTTNPNMKTWTGKAMNLPITGITEAGGIISFDVAGGAPAISAPVAIVPTQGGDNWFNAVWEPVEGATDYFVTVLEKTAGGEPEVNTCDMGNSTTFELPEGWTSSHETVYTTTGNFGVAAPSYKISNDGGWLKTPVFDADITSIKFWHKGQQAEGSYLIVSGIKADNTEVEITRVEPEKVAARTETINEIPQGVRQILITYYKSKGNIAIDDVVVTIGGSSMAVLPGYEAKSSEGETFLRVTTPATPGAEYVYYVTATDGTNVSDRSNTVTVPDLSNSSIAMSKAEASFRVDGRRVVAGEPVVITDLSGRVIFRGMGEYNLPEAGVYIVKGAKAVRKLIVR